MQSSMTPRFSLPLLALGQANKELFHNEALILLDFLVNPSVQAVHDDPSTLSPLEGEAWLIGEDPIGEWALKTNQIAFWTGGGWRFVEPNEHAELFVSNVHETGVFIDNIWVFHGIIEKPAGGSIVDMEARQAIDSILDALRIKAVIRS